MSRIFRIKARNEHNQVLNMREYVSLEKLRLHGKQTYMRYNKYAKAELYEFIDGKWVLEKDELKIRKLINPYQSD